MVHGCGRGRRGVNVSVNVWGGLGGGGARAQCPPRVYPTASWRCAGCDGRRFVPHAAPHPTLPHSRSCTRAGVSAVVREALRYRGPIKRLYRRVVADVCVHPDLTVTPCHCPRTSAAAPLAPDDNAEGATAHPYPSQCGGAGSVCMRAGQWVHFMATEANRDPETFPHPTTFLPRWGDEAGARSCGMSVRGGEQGYVWVVVCKGWLSLHGVSRWLRLWRSSRGL
jgi:hypothetical protein